MTDAKDIKRNQDKPESINIWISILRVAGRVVLYSLLLAGLVFAGIFAWTQTSDFDSFLYAKIRESLDSVFETRVEVNGVLTDLIGSKLVLQDIRVYGSSDAMPMQPATIDSLTIHADFSQILSGKLSIPAITVLKPSFHLNHADDGSLNLPELKRVEEKASEQTDPGGFEITIDNIEVLGGSVSVDKKTIGFDMHAGDMLVQMSADKEGSFDGRARVRGISLHLPAIRRLDLEMTTKFLFSDSEITAKAGMFYKDGQRLFNGEATYEPQTNKFRIEGNLDFDLEYLEAHPDVKAAGLVSLAANVSGLDGIIAGEGRFVVESARFNQYTVSDLQTNITFQEDKIDLVLEQASVLDGKLSGKATIDEVFSEPIVTAHLDIADMPSRKMLELLQMDYLRINASLSLAASFSWDIVRGTLRSADGVLVLAADDAVIKPWNKAQAAFVETQDPTVFSTAVAPLSGKVVFTTEKDGIRLKKGSYVALPESRADFAGKLTQKGIDISLKTKQAKALESGLFLANVDRFFATSWPEYDTIYGMSGLVSSLRGKGDVDFHLFSRNGSFGYDMTFNSNEIQAFGLEASTVTGKIEYRGKEIKIESINARSLGGELDISGLITLNESDVPPTIPPFNEFRIQFKDLDLAELKPLAGVEDEFQLSGEANGKLDIGYRYVDQIKGAGTLAIENAVINGTEIKHAETGLSLDETIILENLHAVGTDGEQFAGSGSFNPVDSAWTLDINLQPLDLSTSSWFTALDPGIAGQIALHADLGGTGLLFEGKAHLSLEDFVFQGSEYGDLEMNYEGKGFSGNLTLDWQGETYQLTSDYQPAGSSSTLVINAAKDGFNLTPIIRLFTGDESLFCTINEGVELRAYLSDGQLFGAGIAIGQVEAGKDNLVFLASDVDLEYTSGLLIFHGVKVQQGFGESREVTINGSMAVDGSGLLRMDVSGGVNLLNFNQALPGMTISGEGFLDLRLRGTLNKPKVFGTLGLAGAFLRDEASGFALSDIQGDVVLNENRVEITSISGRYAQGSILVEGVVEMDMEKLLPASYQITTEAVNLRFPLPEGGNAVAGGVLAITGKPAETLVTGEIDLDQVLYTARFDPEAEVTRFSAAQPLPVPDDALRNVKLDILIRGNDNIRVDNNFARMSVKANVRVLGNMVEMGATGRLEVLEGSIYYRDRKYTVTTGVVEFTDEHSIAPKIDFSAETQVKDYRIFLDMHGTPNRLYPELRSDPSESNLDILNLLAVGEVRQNRFVSDDERARENLLGLGVSGFLTKQFTGEIERRAENLLGVDRFRIDPLILDLSATPTARVTVGEQLTDDLTIIYSTNVSEDDQQVLVVEYQLSPSVQLVATREEDGSYAIDMHLKKLFR